MLEILPPSLRNVKPLSPALPGIALAAALFFSSQAGAAEILKLGLVTSLSDVAASRGQDFVEGFKIGVRSLGGRLGGVEIDLVLSDDQSRPEMAVQAAKRLIEREHIHLVSGAATPEIAQAAADAVKSENGPIFISPAFGPVALAGADCRMGFFSLVPSDDAFLEALARQMKADGANAPAALLVAAQSERDQKRAEILGGLVPEMSVQETGLGNLVFERQLQAIRAQQSKGVVVLAGGGVGAGFLRQMRSWDLREGRTVYADWPMMEPLHLTALGEAGVGLRTIAPWADDPENQVNHRFVADFEDEHRRLPSGFAALGFDLALVLDQAIKNMGGRVGDRASFARAIANSQVQGTRGLIRFANNHFAQTPLFLREGIRDGKGRLIASRKAMIAAPADRHANACRLQAPEAPAPEGSETPAKKKR